MFSVYCHRGAKKPENIHIEEAGIGESGVGDYSNRNVLC